MINDLFWGVCICVAAMVGSDWFMQLLKWCIDKMRVLFHVSWRCADGANVAGSMSGAKVARALTSSKNTSELRSSPFW